MPEKPKPHFLKKVGFLFFLIQHEEVKAFREEKVCLKFLLDTGVREVSGQTKKKIIISGYYLWLSAIFCVLLNQIKKDFVTKLRDPSYPPVGPQISLDGSAKISSLSTSLLKN